MEYNALIKPSESTKPTPSIIGTAISQAFLIERTDVELAQAGKVLAFDFDEHGQIIQIEADSAALAHLSHVKSAAAADSVS
ncbi:hypothetical protein [Halothiobacillus neapolitanus]|uniref:hypothetical protein n=1 Tax=Halothiobacillus neapolitanus TaxID=927 RepID=UPI00105E2CD7|nr:hypothetical protein [Halothiobacillus neapolitanus]